MRRVCSIALINVALLALVSCGKSSTPTAPTPSPNPTVAVRAIVVSSATTSASTFQMSARADMTDGTSKDVTTLATWATSNPAVASISGAGVLTVLASGQIEVRATYQSVTGSIGLLVSGPAAPSTFAISGVAIEVAPVSKILGGVVVTVISGPDSGLTVTTDEGGLFRFPALHTAPLTLEARKQGYLLWRLMNLMLDRDRQIQIVLFPTPPKDASGADATARCNDGTWTWETTRGAACSANGGVAYGVCPGPLCELNVVTQQGR